MKNALVILVMFCVGCGSSKQIAKTESPLHVVITLKQENNALNNVMAAFNGVQKMDKMRVYYPQSVPGAATIDCLWNSMVAKDIERVKKYCEKLPEKISVEYE